MSKIAEQKAMEEYPIPKEEEYSTAFITRETFNSSKREGYIKGYSQAMRDFEEKMKDAISCNVDWYDGFQLDYTQEQQDDVLLKLGVDVGDKVKIIIVKEE